MSKQSLREQEINNNINVISTLFDVVDITLCKDSKIGIAISKEIKEAINNIKNINTAKLSSIEVSVSTLSGGALITRLMFLLGINKRTLQRGMGMSITNTHYINNFLNDKKSINNKMAIRFHTYFNTLGVDIPMDKIITNKLGISK
tara:strand:- start:53 stop:490 length:438 start_codon:yes stop_codon:yes gene_type:complete